MLLFCVFLLPFGSLEELETELLLPYVILLYEQLLGNSCSFQFFLKKKTQNRFCCICEN